MKNLPIDTLRSFVTIADLGSITSAAEQLGRSQPALSLQLKRLEDMLETALLARQNRKLTLTSDGLIAYQTAKEILNLNDQLIGRLKKTELAGLVRLGIPSEFATTLLPKIIGRFAASYTNVTLEVVSDLSRNLLSDEQRGRYDLILGLHDRSISNRRGRISSDELVWVGHSKQRIERGQTLPLILAQEGCIYRKRALSILDRIKRPWRIVHTNPDLSGIKTAIEEGLGITVLTRSTVPEGLVILGKGSNLEGLPELGTIDISLQYDKHSATEATERLAGFIRSSF